MCAFSMVVGFSHNWAALHSYAYVEFAEPEHVDAAMALDSSLFKGRLLKACSFFFQDEVRYADF
jgi:hypothetical protein